MRRLDQDCWLQPQHAFGHDIALYLARSTVNGGGAQTIGSGNRFSTFMPLVQRESELREQAEQRVENGSRGFNRIYTGE